METVARACSWRQLRLPFISGDPFFLAIQHADNVNNANNIFKKQKKKHQVSGRMQNFSASFFGWGVRGGNLVMLYLNPLKHNIFEVANWQIHSINYK